MFHLHESSPKFETDSVVTSADSKEKGFLGGGRGMGFNLIQVAERN